MTTLKEELYTRLTIDAGVSAIVGARVYSNAAPESATFPLIVFEVDSAAHEHHAGGAAGLVSASVDIECYEEGATLVSTLADAVRNSLQGFNGDLGALRVTGVFLDNEFDEVIQRPTGHPTTIYRTTLEFTMWHRETIPSP